MGNDIVLWQMIEGQPITYTCGTISPTEIYRLECAKPTGPVLVLIFVNHPPTIGPSITCLLIHNL